MARLPLHRWRYSTRLLFSGCDQAIYQQDLVVHRTAGQDYEEVSGGLKVWHIYIGPKCRPDYGDLRFTDGNARELAYYLWPGFTATSAQICVRLEGADLSGVLGVHYGNPSATTTSDGDATYLFFDDCEGSDPSDKWIDAAGAGTKAYVTDPYLGTKSLKVSGDSKYVAGRMTPVSSAIFEARIKQAGNYNSFFTAIGSTSAYTFYAFRPNFNSKAELYKFASGTATLSTDTTGISSTTWRRISMIPNPSTAKFAVYVDGTLKINARYTTSYSGVIGARSGVGGTSDIYLDQILVRAFSAAPPSLIRGLRRVNPSYAGLSHFTPGDSVIRFGGVGTIQVLDDEKYFLAGAGSFSIETRVSSPIPVTTVVGFDLGLHMVVASVMPEGAGGVALGPAHLRTPLDVEIGVGTPYVAPTPVQFDVWQYRFESLDISRSAQDALWRCDGQIEGLQAPLAYKSFAVKVPDHNGVLRTIFFGFVPERDYVQAVAANKSTVQGFDAGFYLTRQYLPNGDLYYPAAFLWTPMNLIKYWLGEETTQAGSPSYWERVSGIMPYRIHDPSTYSHPYTPKDWNFQPKTTKVQAIQEVCEYSGMVFLVKWRSVNGAMTPCAYLVHQDDIDHATHGLDLPPMVTFTHPDPRIANGVRATLQSDEKYNRIEVRSASPSGAWFHAVRETAALRAGEELPIEYLEERSDLPINADHGGWCNARADELYAYYTKYAYTYTLTLINRVDLELYQRCRFYGFGVIPDGDVMRIVAIRYNVRPTHTEVEITVTPDSRLSDLRRLQRSQAADSVSEVQTIARGQIDRLAAGEVGTVIEIDGNEAIVELERKADSSVRGRIV